MRTPLSLRRRAWYPWAFLSVASLAVVLLYLWRRDALSAELLLSVLGGVAAFFHFLYSQHNSNTDRFIALFKDFNTRFDTLNNSLNQIYAHKSSDIFGPEDLQTLYDYFNLCAEEYLFYKAGFIDEEVWQSWTAGMAYFASNQKIRRVWEAELSQGSYYDFQLSLIPTLIQLSKSEICWPQK